MVSRHLRPLALAIALAAGAASATGLIHAQAPQAPTPAFRDALIDEQDIRRWLTYLSSDQMQGREVFTEGYGLAASYVADELRSLGLRPLGDSGSYFQTVRWQGYRVARKSKVVVTAGGETRTFEQGDHISLPFQSGGRQTLKFDKVEFAGYGLVAVNGNASHNDFANRDVKGRLVTYLPGIPKALAGGRRSPVADRNRPTFIVQSFGAAGVISFTGNPIVPPAAGSSAPTGGRGRAAAAGGGADLETVLNVEATVPPTVTADQTFYEFLFRASPVPFADLRAMAERGDPLPPITLEGVTVTIDVENTYELLTSHLTQNVVAMVEGRDPVLKDTYVFLGAHLDHVGYSAEGQEAKGRVNTPLSEDRIWNGADDDGSGSSALLAMAKAFMTGPRPKRSLVFVWHAGEEAGLLGSLRMADSPVVPLERIQAELNIDMIGRNRDDNPDQIDTLYVIGADRISTDLHNLLIDTNATLERPMTLDFEYNDPNDSNSFYTRSDHYSYAAKGIPIAFFFTGTHPDYHANTDTVDKIIFPKLVRVARLIYRTAFEIGDRDTPLVRDNLGSRSGRDFSGKIPVNP